MAIMKETPWSRIQGQNSVHKEFLEIVGNGNPTGSVLEETVALSVTISMNVRKWHSRIRLQILSCSRMREMRREPEVPEEGVPVVECLDGPARITSKELAPSHSVKSGTLQNACSTRPRVVVGLVKSVRMHIGRLMNNLVKGPKRMMTKVQYPCWRRMICTKAYGNLLSTVTKVTTDRWDPMSNVIPVMSWNKDLLDADHQVHDNRVVSLKTCSRRSLSYGRARHAETNSTCEIHKGYCTSHKNSRPKSFARIYLPRWTSWAQPQRSKIWGSVSGGDRVARARCPRSSVEAGQESVKIKGAWKSNILLTFGN